MRETEFGEVPPGRIAVQVQQPPGLVVGQLDALLAVDQEQALAHGVQHGLVVLHHPRQGGRRQSVRLTADPTAQRPTAQGTHGQVAAPVPTMPGTAAARSSPMASTVSPADTSATTSPSASWTGPVARTDGPRVPV